MVKTREYDAQGTRKQGKARELEDSCGKSWLRNKETHVSPRMGETRRF